jgi:hypothetical protein
MKSTITIAPTSQIRLFLSRSHTLQQCSARRNGNAMLTGTQIPLA